MLADSPTFGSFASSILEKGHTMKDIQAIQQLIANPKKTVIIPHANPDADALGSALGLGRYLEKKGHSVTVISPNEYPDFLKWMAGNEAVVCYQAEVNAEEVKNLVTGAEVIFCLDYSDPRRIDDLEEWLLAATATKVMIDHHLNPVSFADLSIHDISAAATAQLVAEYIMAAGDEDLMDAEMANCLYAGIMTDTGSFRHSNTNANVLKTAARLVEHGAVPGDVSRWVYDTNSLNRLRFLGYALNKLLEVNDQMGVAFFVITRTDSQRFNLQTGDTEGLVNYALSIKGMKVAALFKEHEEKIKISFRSVGDIAVNKFAEQYFAGGGHRNAAGGMSKEGLAETVGKFRQLMEENALEIR